MECCPPNHDFTSPPYFITLLTIVHLQVNGSQIADKAYPWDVRNPPAPANGHDLPNSNAVGCWRAHSNVWSHIISSGISSALILEDDADFSVGIRDIMEGISQHLGNITGARNGEPYGIVDGKSWDLLSLGACGHRMPDPKTNPKAAAMLRTWVDPWAPDNDQFVKGFYSGDPNDRVRMLTISKGFACTQGYAVTREGAMRLLYLVGGQGHPLNAPMDLLLYRQMSEGLIKGFLAAPDVVAQWKVGDWRDTDISPTSGNGKGSGRSIIRSVREEIMQMLGNRNVWEEIENGGAEEVEEGEKEEEEETKEEGEEEELERK